MMELELADNGMGLAVDHKEGVGLSNTRSRLRQLYEDRHSFEIAGGKDGGVLVKIAIPLRLLPAQNGGFLDDDTHRDCGRRSAGPPADSVAAPTR
jgi:hypothetical protein